MLRKGEGLREHRRQRAVLKAAKRRQLGVAVHDPALRVPADLACGRAGGRAVGGGAGATNRGATPVIPVGPRRMAASSFSRSPKAASPTAVGQVSRKAWTHVCPAAVASAHVGSSAARFMASASYKTPGSEAESVGA